MKIRCFMYKILIRKVTSNSSCQINVWGKKVQHFPLKVEISIKWKVQVPQNCTSVQYLSKCTFHHCQSDWGGTLTVLWLILPVSSNPPVVSSIFGRVSRLDWISNRQPVSRVYIFFPSPDGFFPPAGS